MKILFLNLYSNKIARGAESFAHSLARELEKNGYEVDFLKGNSALMPTNTFRGSFLDRILKRLFLDKPGREVLLFSLKSISTLLSGSYDVVIPMNGFWQLVIVKLVQIIKPYKVIVTGHSGPGWDERWNLYLKPNYFVATTQPTLEWAQKTAPWTQSILIPYGIDPEVFKLKPALEKSGLVQNLESPWVLCPSALVPYKRVDLAIKAMSRLEKGSLIILGKGPLEKKLNRMGKRLLGEKRFLITSVAYEEIPAYFGQAQVITLPSAPQENSPMVFLEALAAGKSIVATDAPRVRWALEDAGIYIDPTQLDSYAQALQEALTKKSNSQKPLQKFLWPDVIKKYEALFSR